VAGIRGADLEIAQGRFKGGYENVWPKKFFTQALAADRRVGAS
jgi:hypothetical protein